jgi:flagellar assembly protein FliH
VTSSSERPGRDLSPDAGARPASTYARFIPREELQGARAWQPGSFGEEGTQAAREALPEAVVQGWKARLAAERQEGYQEGYRDGLVALEGFKKSYATQTAARVGQLLESFDAHLVALEDEMAQALARATVLLARQVLRDELRTNPQHVAAVAREAVAAMVTSARQIVVRVHPDDLPLVDEGAGDALRGRGARLLGDAGVQRGGCHVESDAGTVDATIAARWARAAGGIGHPTAWADTTEDAPGAPANEGSAAGGAS